MTGDWPKQKRLEAPETPGTSQEPVGELRRRLVQGPSRISGGVLALVDPNKTGSDTTGTTRMALAGSGTGLVQVGRPGPGLRKHGHACLCRGPRSTQYLKNRVRSHIGVVARYLLTRNWLGKIECHLHLVSTTSLKHLLGNSPADVPELGLPPSTLGNQHFICPLPSSSSWTSRHAVLSVFCRR